MTNPTETINIHLTTAEAAALSEWFAEQGWDHLVAALEVEQWGEFSSHYPSHMGEG